MNFTRQPLSARLRHPQNWGSRSRLSAPRLTMPSQRTASQSCTVSLLALRSWNLITASLANLELIHFRWRWLITADGKSHPGRTSTLLAVNKKGWTWLFAAISRGGRIYGKWLLEIWNAFVYPQFDVLGNRFAFLGRIWWEDQYSG